MVQAASPRPFLVQFIQKPRFLSFCFQELESLAQILSIPKAELYAPSGGTRPQVNLKNLPYVRIQLPSECHAQLLNQRAILVKDIIDEIGRAPTFDLLFDDGGLDRAKLSGLADKRFMFKVEGLGRSISRQEQLDIINRFDATDLRQENVDLNDPEVCFHLLDDVRNNTVIFGRRVSQQRDATGQSFFAKYDLSKRPYLGPTSTDHELAFLMANQAQIEVGDLVYDPFVGSGSIALAMSHFGAHVFGSDLDMRVLRGWGVGRKTYNETISEQLCEKEDLDIFTNFKYYGLPSPEIFSQDVLKLQLRRGRKLDAIVCDPPYGIRVRSKKLRKDPSQEVKDNFSVDSIYAGLLELGARHLRQGGRLVFLYHSDMMAGEELRFPEHQAFTFVDASENALTKNRIRHCITLEKN